MAVSKLENVVFAFELFLEKFIHIRYSLNIGVDVCLDNMSCVRGFFKDMIYLPSAGS